MQKINIIGRNELLCFYLSGIIVYSVICIPLYVLQEAHFIHELALMKSQHISFLYERLDIVVMETTCKIFCFCSMVFFLRKNKYIAKRKHLLLLLILVVVVTTMTICFMNSGFLVVYYPRYLYQTMASMFFAYLVAQWVREDKIDRVSLD